MKRELAVVAARYDAVKVVSIPYAHYVASNRDIDRVADMMIGLRKVVGPDVAIMVDCHGRPASVALARDFIRAVEPCRPMFVEKPLPPEDMDGLAHLTATSTVHISAGERLIGRRHFAEALKRRAFHIAQPDICHALV